MYLLGICCGLIVRICPSILGPNLINMRSFHSFGHMATQIGQTIRGLECSSVT